MYKSIICDFNELEFVKTKNLVVLKSIFPNSIDVSNNILNSARASASARRASTCSASGEGPLGQVLLDAGLAAALLDWSNVSMLLVFLAALGLGALALLVPAWAAAELPASGLAREAPPWIPRGIESFHDMIIRCMPRQRAEHVGG